MSIVLSTYKRNAKKFMAIKNYYAHLRICAFNDFIAGIKDSHELEILERIDYLLKGFSKSGHSSLSK